MKQRGKRLTRWALKSVLSLIMVISMLLPNGIIDTTQPVAAHNLDASAVYVFFDPDTQAMLDARIANGWSPGTPLIQVGDEIGLIIKAVPDNGTTTGVGGYTTFYIPNGAQVIDAAFLIPGDMANDGITGYDKIPAKGQALMPNVGAGGGPTVNLTGISRGPNIAGVTANLVNSANVNNGTLPAVYGDLGIFYSTAPETAYGSYTGGQFKNNSGDIVGWRTPLGKPLNLWDAWQMAGFGINGLVSGPNILPATPRVDSNGRGNTIWGNASAVAGPQSGYAWDFRLDDYVACAGSATAAPTRECVDAATDQMGPWKRIQYPGSQIAYDIPGDTTLGKFAGGLDASNIGFPLSPSTPLTPTTGQANGTPNAIRFAYGQLTLNTPEYAWVKFRVNSFTDMLDATGCPIWRVDTFGGDAGGDDNGKDHLWRYYDPNSVQLNGCLAVGKPATRDIVKVGDFYQYNLYLYNAGNTDLTNVVVTDQLPAGVTFISAVPAQNSGPNPLRWVIGSLQRGQSWKATVTVRASGTGILLNTMTASGQSGLETITSTAAERTISGLAPYLRQGKSVNPSTAAPGSTVAYTIQIDNIGTGATGNPIVITEYLPAGFTYEATPAPTARVNGAVVTPAVNAANPNRPVFTIPAALQAGQTLFLTFTARIAANQAPGSYCNSYTSSTPVNQTTGALACVNVAGGAIGDTIWRDWNGNGVQDPGEEGIAGVTVQLYDSTGATLLATTTTDANGNYYFNGLTAGTYVVKVNGGVTLAGYTQTGDPDATFDNAHTVTLAENQRYLTADFGYRPSGTASIGDTIFEDIGNDGFYDSAVDFGIPGVTVYLYEDSNGDGIITPGQDALVATTTTGSCPGATCGVYSFTNLAPGYNYLVSVNPVDTALTTYFGASPFQASTPNPHRVTNLTGAYLLADIGFWRVAPGSIGDQVFLDNNGDGVYNAGDAPLAGVTVWLYRDANNNGIADPGELAATTVSAADGTYSFGNLGPGNYLVIVDTGSVHIPAGYASTTSIYRKSLAAGENYLAADFPFVPLISKTVNKSYVDPNGTEADRTLTFGITANYPGQDALENVKVIDPLPTGVTYVGGSANAGGTYGPYVSQPGTPGEDAAPALGMAIYNNNNDTFRYRTWNVDDGFSAETNGANMGTRIQMMAGASSPTTAERVITFMDGARHVFAAIWNGTTWSAVPVPPANAAPGRMTSAALTTNSNLYWGTAVAYEQSSGHLMLVWNDDANATAGADDELRYVTRENNVWGTVTSLATAANQPQNLRIAARPNSDQLALVYSSASGADYIRLWSGTAWSSETALDTTGGSPTSVNVAYEAQSGRVMVVYGKPTATSASLFYRIYDGSAWSAEASITPPAGVASQPQWVAIASDPFSNRIAVGVVTSGGHTWLSVWNGSAWVNTIEATSSALTSGAQNVAVAFETLSGDLLAAYGVNSAPTAQVRYRTWTWNPVTQTGAWSSELGGPSGNTGNPNVIMLTRSPTTNRIMMALNTSDSDANYISWDGSAWDETVLQASPNTQVTGQQPMIYLWNRASTTEESTATSATATPTTVALGDSITVKVEIKSARTINNVTPSLSTQHGSATCTTADTVPANVLAGVAKTFTFTCIPSTLGEIHFVAEASSAGGYVFPDAESNTVLVSANGASDVVTWNLGSTTPAQAASTASSKYVYAFRGAGSNAFWAYNPATNVWNNPLDPADNTGVNIGAGGALATDGTRYIYALQGGGTQGFHRYDASTNTWSARASTGVNINTGGALVYLNGKLYAFAGNNTTTFLIYDVAGNSWSAGASVPLAVGQGGALATDGRYIYGLRGNRKPEFYRYDPLANTWMALLRAPANIGKGGSLVYANGALYALRGDGQKTFYRYNIAANTWTTLAPTPGNIAEGGALTFDGQYIYAFQGKTTTFYRYNIASNLWETRMAAPAATGWGGALTYLESGNITHSRMQAYPTLVTDGPGDQQVKVLLTLTAENTVNNISAGTISVAGVNGANATCVSPPTLKSADDDLTSPTDSVVFEWACTVTAGTSPGSVRFSANATGNGGATTFGTATSNSVLLTPPLIYQAVVNTPATVNVVENTALLNSNEGIDPTASNTTRTATTASIGDYVWADLDGDGVQDAGEPGLAGVKVYIDSNNNGMWDPGEPYAITDAYGAYRIFGLSAGNYVVRTDPATYPAGYLPTTPPAHTVTGLAAGQQYNNADFGLQPPGTGSIGDTIWLDADNDGVKDADEAGLPGIGVTLEINIGGTWYPIATTTTDANGQYAFTGLRAGNYRVVVDPNSSVTSPYDPAVTSTLGAAMQPTYDKDGISTAHTAVVTLGTGPGQSMVHTDLDFGYNWGGSIGNFVWYDTNGDGLQNETECSGAPCGAPGGTLVLYYDTNGNGELDPGEPPLAYYEVLADGYYIFANLPPGKYVVAMSEQEIPSPVTGQVNVMVHTVAETIGVTLGPNQHYADADFGVIEAARLEGSVYHDINHNSFMDGAEPGLEGIEVFLSGYDLNGNYISLQTTTDEHGEYVFIVPPGNYTITYNTTQVPPALSTPTTATSLFISVIAGMEYTGLDFGVDHSGAIGDRVWNDANGNGVQDADELGLPGVTVNLYASDGITLLATTVTDANGYYLFPGLADDTYVVKVVPATVPAGFTQTYDNYGAMNDHTGQATISGGNTINTVDFGYYNAAAYTVSGTVWNDLDGDGNMDDSAFLAGVTVCLHNSSGAVVACTVTNASGDYTFPGIPNGDYTIRVNPSTLPNSAYVPTYDPNGIGTPHVTGITVSGGPVSGQNFGYQQQLGSISGTICEGNGNGDCAVGETTLPGVPVFLVWAGPDGLMGTDDDEVYITTTDSNGDYTFDNLLPGLYQVSKMNPAGYVSLADADGGNPSSIYLTLGVGQHKDNQDFELQRDPGVIGDRVWLDVDGDGVQDIGESGLANVTVYLYSVGPDGEPGGGDDVLIATTTTDANGNYLFTDVPPGAYYVAVETATLPTGLTASPGTYTGAKITLLAGQSYLNADLGYVPATGTAVIGDFVWADANGNGLQDPGEIGLAGVTVTLKDSNGNTVATTTTGPDGRYLFTNVAPGSYTVAVTPPAGYTVTSGPESEGANTSRVVIVRAGDVVNNVDFGYDNPALWSITDRLWYDADRDGVFDAGESGIGGVTVNLLDEDGNVMATVVTGPDGTFTFSGMPNGHYTIQIADVTNQLGGYQETTPDAVAGRRNVTVAGADVTGAHFGYAGLGPIGDTIWSDHNGNGVQDPGEIGIAGVTVQLYYDTNGDGIYNAGDTLIATTTTDASGNYLFNDLPAGTFFVVVTPPAGYTQTGDPDATLDNATKVILTPIAVSFLDADFGYRNTTLADVSGSIWNDLNRNGRDDGASEPPLAGVTVALLDSNGNVVATTVTAADGSYTFYDLPAGSYTVKVTDQHNVLAGYQLTSGLDAIPVTVGATDITGIDFGYVRNPATGVIGDRVWMDANRDGVQNGAEPGIANVTVWLKAAAPIVINGVPYATGDTIATTKTDLNGNYLFTGLPAGSYSVDVDGTTLPSGLAATTGTSDPRAVTLTDGQVYLDADFGYASSTGIALGDRVWHDVNGDGIQDPGEPGIGGVEVKVYDNNNTLVATVYTDPDGSWLVTGLTAGNYKVTVTPPTGYNPLPTNGAASRDYTLPAGQDALYADFGFKLPTGTTYATIGDRIWLDANGNGAQDAGEIGIPGVTVNLVSGGVIIATTTTNADGNYLFSGVPDGTYTVQVSDVGNVLGGMLQTGDPDAVLNGQTTVIISGGHITHIGGIECTNCDNDLDFGYQPSGGVIGNQVWRDLDGDGYRDAGEPGVQGVTIALWLDVNGDGAITPGVDNLVRTTVTDENGQYAFTGLPAGKYLVDVTDKYGVLAGMTLTDGTDNTDNHSQVDPYPVELTLTGGVVSSNFTADFGYKATTPLIISGIVFGDTNNNGSWAAPEPLIPGARLSLYRVVDGEWFLIGATTSNGSGYYEFTDLPAGEYRVVADVSNTSVSGKFQTTQTGTNAVQPVTLSNANSPNNDFGFYAPPFQPTAVTLALFSAEAQGQTVLVVWETAMELDNLGFNLYRSESADGPWVKLNAELIPAQHPGAVFGARYEWLDETVAPEHTYYYRLEDVDIYGVSTFHGPISVSVTSPSATTVTGLAAQGGPVLGIWLWAVAALGWGFKRRERR